MATSTIATEVAKRGRGRPKKPTERQTFAGSLAAAIRGAQVYVARIRFPNPAYRDRPVDFFRQVLGVEPWHRQVDIINAVRDYRRVAVRSGHKISKRLALDTPVPTVNGWSTIGELRVGDVVFDELGRRCNVTGLSDVVHGSECYEVIFDDGTRVTTDATHAWNTWTHRARRACDRAGLPRTGPGEITTTEEIRRTLRTKHAGRNHAVVTAAPIQCRTATLPIDPYLLGVWLGDGDANRAYITTPDLEIEAAFQAAGYATARGQAKGKAWRFSIDPGTKCSRFRAGLQSLGLLKNKHIPSVYLRGDETQRRALLAGLLDTDGTCNDGGRVMFVNTNRRIARGVFELAASLGYKPHWAKRRAKLYGVDCGAVYEVGFTAHDPVFRLPRQLAKQHTGKTKQQWVRQRMIERVRPVPSVPVRCIEVDSPSHLFLVSHAFIPTHNSHTAAGIALWFYCSFPDARVIMSSTTARQVDQILWRELRIMRARSGRCTECKAKDPEAILIPKPCPHSTLIEGEQGDLARTGLKAPDFREIVGFTAREAEAVAGISGSHLLYILDEASGIEEVIYEAIAGNMAGGGRVVLFGNPTKNEGEFYAAFHDKKHLYHGITVSSEETPNVQAGRVIIPGLATREWIDEKKDEWGEDSPLYKIRILGVHATHEEGRIFSVHMIEQAEQRWEQTPEAGRLFIGVDPAGESGIGDETIMCPRRGLKQLAIQGYRGASADMLVTHVTRMITALRLPREVPVVVVDAEGPIGIKLCRLLAEYLDQYPDAFELVRVYASHRATRQPKAYERVRDELAANLESWFRDGGAIIEDTRLAAELHSFEWIEQVNGRLKCTPKDTIRKQLQRSPDRYDALALATWEPLSLRTGHPANDNARLAANDNDGPSRSERIFDPYAAANTWRR